MSSTLWNEVSNCSASTTAPAMAANASSSPISRRRSRFGRRRSFGRNRRIENAEVLALVAGFNRLGQPRLVELPRQDVIVFLRGAVVALDLEVAFLHAGRRIEPLLQDGDPCCRSFSCVFSRASSSSKSLMLRLLRGSADRFCGALVTACRCASAFCLAL